MREQIKEYIRSHGEETVALLEALCRIPAPSHKEEARAEFCLQWLRENGAEDAYIDGAQNVILPMEGESDRLLTVFAAHTDTVFPDTLPMPVRKENGKLYCPGVGDDTASVAVLMMTVKFLLEKGIRPRSGALFVLNSCEEGLGNLKGTRTLMDAWETRVGQFVTYDGSRLNALCDRCVGSHRYEVEVQTPGGHSFRKFGDPNAIEKLSQIVTRIYEIEVPQKGNSRTTYNVGTVCGGTSVNTIAQSASMLCEYRSDDADCLAIMKEHFLRIFREAEEPNVKVLVRNVGERPCANVDAQMQEAFAAHCGRVIRSVIGEEVVFSSASTDCNIPLSRGIPAVCIGVFVGNGAHTREEWVELSSLSQGFEVSANLVLDLIG